MRTIDNNQNKTATPTLVDAPELARDLSLPVRAVWRLWREKKIPGIPLGYRTLRFRKSAVIAALLQMERH
jgi:predicted DNA-binding transcriptional regulator AlpA